MADEKYVVFRANDFNQFRQSISSETIYVAPLDDAVVIRLQDAFAATALHTYSNTIMNFVDLMISYEVIDESTRKRLIEIADYFHEKAMEADAIQGKLPD